jgi:hypothetical protein
MQQEDGGRSHRHGREGHHERRLRLRTCRAEARSRHTGEWNPSLPHVNFWRAAATRRNAVDSLPGLSLPCFHSDAWEQAMTSSRREMLQLAGAGLASAAILPFTKSAEAQLPEVANSPPVTIVQRGINRELDVINIDLLESQARGVLSDGVYVFIATGSGEQWTLRENRRAFGDYALNPHPMGGIVRDRIDTSITILGERLPHPIFVSPMGSHGLVHPEAEAATARGMAKSGGMLCVSSASTIAMEEIARASATSKWFQMYLDNDAGLSREILRGGQRRSRLTCLGATLTWSETSPDCPS